MYMSFTEFMAGVSEKLTGLAGEGVKNAKCEYRAGRLDKNTYKKLNSDYNKLKAQNKAYQSRVEAERKECEAEEKRRAAEESERQRRFAEECEHWLQQHEMLQRKEIITEKTKRIAKELMGELTESKYHEKTLNKIYRSMNKIEKIIIKNNRLLFVNDKNKVIVEYKYIGIGYTILPVYKMLCLWWYFDGRIEKDFKCRFKSDKKSWECIGHCSEILDLSYTEPNKVLTLDYIPTESYNQQFYSLFNDCIGEEDSVVLIRED